MSFDRFQSTYHTRGSADLWWFNKANDLRGAVAAIDCAQQGKINDELDKYGFGKGYSFAVALPGVFALNAALSIELLLKAIIVLAEPSDFEKVPKVHDLIKLADKAAVSIHITQEQKDLLNVLSIYIQWAGRYPVARDYDAYARGIETVNRLTMRRRAGELPVLVANERTIPNWENFKSLWDDLSNIYWERKNIHDLAPAR